MLLERPEHIQPLERFLAAAHPLDAARRAQLGAENGNGNASGVFATVASGDAAMASAAFYLQSLALADFLIERSGRQTLLAEVSQALASGTGLEAWLADNGERHHLGSDVSGLRQHWNAWLQSHRQASAE